MTKHEAQYETYEGWTTVQCACANFYRICESEEVAEAEFANHVDLSRSDA